MKRFALLIAMSLLVSCASHSKFEQRYDRYFPPKSAYVDSFYRQYYDKRMFGEPPPKMGPEPGTTHLWQLYHAFHGDAAATHLFFHNPDRDADGEFGEAWYYDCVLLLLRFGDDRFSGLLMREDPQTREKVGIGLDTQIDFQKDPFPKTRSLYRFRWHPHKRPAT